MTANSCPPVTWHRGPLLGFDLETTGVNVEQDRVVTAATVLINPGKEPITLNRLADPGIDIPKGASDIHGITTAHAQEHGEPIEEVLEIVTGYLANAINDATPIVGMNLVYDLTLLDRECRRHGLKTLTQRVERVAPIIDVLVLDKAMDKYRKGSRKLTALSEHYGVTLDNAHNSGADALASCRIAHKIAVKYPAIQIDPITLHNHQIVWAGGQKAHLAAYHASIGKPHDDQDNTWPIRPIKTH